MTEVVAWVKWRFDKWRNDEGLRMCSMAARGLWADLLAIMHGCTPYGHLMINGRVPTPKQIASLVGMTTEKEVVECLTELKDNGVCSVAGDNGAIYCRRMVRDNQAREQSKEYGLRGGNPNLAKRVGRGVNPPLGKVVKIEGEEEREREKEDAREARQPGLRSHSANGAGPPRWPDVRIVESEGRPSCNGIYIDSFSERLAEAACLPLVPLADKTMLGWLADGYETDEILPVIRRVVERSGHIPKSLAYFDKAVRETQPTYRPLASADQRRTA